MNCPGSVRMSAGIERKSSVYADEGSAAHALAERCLDTDQDAAAFEGYSVSMEKGQAVMSATPAGTFPVNDDMMSAVQLYLDTARSLIEPGDEWSIEQREDLSDFHPDVFGTSDLPIYKPATKTLVIVDYKHGRGVAVEAKSNPQLLTYALGALWRFHNRGVETVKLVIVQPRCPHADGPVRTWEIGAVDLFEFGARLEAAAKATEAPDAPLVAGEWCKFCPAAPMCPALRGKVLDIARVEFTEGDDIVLIEPKQFNGEALATVLREIDVIEDWCRRVREHAHHEAEAGRVPPGFKLVPTRPSRKWRDKEGLPSRLDAEFGMTAEHIFEAPDVRSPAQIEAVLRKHYGYKGKAATAAIAEMVESVSSGTVLAPLDDARRPVRPEAAEEFAA